VSTNPAIPFLDLITPHQELRDELFGVFNQALGTAGFIGGPMVEDFEREFATYCEAQYCVGVANGTDALRFALMAAGVKAGDIVVTVPNTFIATTEAISQAGALPRFVDIDERSYNLDPVKLRWYLETECRFDAATGKTIEIESGRPVTAVVPVHLYGQTADMDAILDLAGRFGLIVVEDACQAHGAQYFSKRENRWRKAGSMGSAAAFSFYPGKNLGACGEAGAVTTSDPDLARKMRMLRDHGQSKKYYHEIEGYNGRLDAIQAGFLRVKLKHLPGWTEKRRAIASRYRELFRDMDAHILLPYESSSARSVYHLFVVRVQNREQLMKYLASANIGTGIHYPIPLHLQNAYRHLGYQEGDFPVTERIAPELLSLPMYPQLGALEQARVADEVSGFLETQGRTMAAAV
jgi:dTDP-4-amino-4,6-dideoxygalactose transaminase